ncbi:UNVERIFIED_CONTAM: hypothetical protein HHA_235960 [Hammondia hammondi]|eukprot:XP_008885513.1 hypothetical protein HHA_235960 [Hammondia hammondi]
MAMATRKNRLSLPAPSSTTVFLLVLTAVAGSCFVVRGFAESSTLWQAHTPDDDRGQKPSAGDKVETLYSTEVENTFSSSPSSLNYTSLDLCPCSAGELLGDPRTDTSWLACSKTHAGSPVYPFAFDVAAESRSQSYPSRLCMSATGNSGVFPACEGASHVWANGTQSATSQVHTGESRAVKKGQKAEVAGMEDGVRVSGRHREHDENGSPPHAVSHNDNGHPKSKTFSRSSNRERKSASQERRQREASPVLALEWKRFPYDFSRGEFEVHGFPLYVEGPSHIRPAHLQQDADTGKSIWDGSVVLARFVSQRLFPAPHTSEASSSIQEAAPEPSKEASCEDPPRRRVVIELGAGLGVAGLAAAAAGTHVAWELRKREREMRARRGSDKDACATQKDTAQANRESDLAGVAVSGGEAHVASAKRNHVILTDLPYCLDTLAENVRRNSHFAVESRPSTEAADAEGRGGSSRDAAPKTQLSLESNEKPAKSQVSVVALDWNEPEKFTEAAKGVVHPGEVEVLLGADIVWLASLVEPLVKTIDWFFTENRKWMMKAGDETSAEDTEVKQSTVTRVVAYISHQTRSEKTDETLFRALAARGLEVEVQQFDDPIANRSPNIRILKIWKND